MKKKWIYIIGSFVILLTLAVILTLWQNQTFKNFYEVLKARTDITNYFEAIIHEDYSKAVKYVSFFNAYDNTYIDSNEQLNNKWINRISNLTKKNIYIEKIVSLDIKTVDGVICAQISLSINDVGYSDIVTYILELVVNKNAGLFDIKYLISDVTNEEFRFEIEDALSGIVKE